MTDYDRRVLIEEWEHSFPVAEFPVLGSTVISKGDLLVLDRSDGIRLQGTSTSNFTVYPFGNVSGVTKTLDSNKTLAKQNFVGVAAWHSDSGVTETLAVYIDGLFKYPLKGSRHTRAIYRVTPVGSGVTLHSQKVAVDVDSDDNIGVVCDSGEFRDAVNVRISTIFSKFEFP